MCVFVTCDSAWCHVFNGCVMCGFVGCFLVLTLWTRTVLRSRGCCCPPPTSMRASKRMASQRAEAATDCEFSERCQAIESRTPFFGPASLGVVRGRKRTEWPCTLRERTISSAIRNDGSAGSKSVRSQPSAKEKADDYNQIITKTVDVGIQRPADRLIRDGRTDGYPRCGNVPCASCTCFAGS